MGDSYELLDLRSGNLVGYYDSAEEALAILQRAVERYGRSAIANLSLMRIHDDDQILVAMKEELVTLVDAFSRRSEQSASSSLKIQR